MSQRLVSARCLPGHILESTTISDRGCGNGADYLRPKPKTTSNGFGRAASSIYLSGSNTSGRLQSRKMALRMSFLKSFRRRKQKNSLYVCHNGGPSWYKVFSVEIVLHQTMRYAHGYHGIPTSFGYILRQRKKGFNDSPKNLFQDTFEIGKRWSIIDSRQPVFPNH